MSRYEPGMQCQQPHKPHEPHNLDIKNTSTAPEQL